QLVTLYSTARLADVEGGAWPELGSANRYAGVVAELSPGFADWCARVREISPCLPVMVIAKHVDPCLLARLQARSIEVATLPLHAPQVVAFVQRSLASAFLPSERVARMVAFVATSRGLTAREVQLLSYCLAD